MCTEETLLRSKIAILIIENCKHISTYQSACVHCIESAKIAVDENI